MGVTVSGETRVAGVFGCPVSHSQSPAMHNAAFGQMGLDFVYVPFDVHPDNLEAAVGGIRALNMVGVNVTIPHKERVIPFLDWVSEDALLIRSVNTIHYVDGQLRGYSTDGEGFIRALKTSGKDPTGSKAVVLGAGGSARATAHALVTSGAEVTVANRTFGRAVELAELLRAFSIRPIALDSVDARKAIREADLLVNCTSVGMHPKADDQPIPSEWLHNGLFVYDQIYNPLETRLLKAARSAGCQAANGVKMLVFQGAVSFELWTGKTPPIEVMETAVLEGLRSRP